MDIRFYDMNFNLKHILPDYATSKAIISANARFDFNGNGYFELDFDDDQLCDMVMDCPELLIVWGKWQGFLTGYNFSDNKKKLFGLHLNGLLSHEVINDTTASSVENVETILYEKIASITWLDAKTAKGTFTNQVQLFKNAFVCADEWVQELLSLDNAGYKISADFDNKEYLIEVLQRSDNDIVISESNLNAYDVIIDYNAKKKSYGGWYKNSSDTWVYIQSQSASGIFRRDTVLKANNSTDALAELKALLSAQTITSMTRNIKYASDYNLGDIITFKTAYGSSRKFVKTVFISSEKNSYIESPEFEEVEE